MYKEIRRKITSLTLLSILLASGVTFAMPGAIPVAEAAHNANLFVSSENSQFNNYFAGPQVVEVVVNDPNIADTDEAKGEPDVTVNGKKMRMIQATDGNWYGYIADRTQAQRADQTQNVTSGTTAGSTGEGLDFGKFCASTSTILGFSVSDTVGIAIGKNSTTVQGSDGTATPFPVCTGTADATEERKIHVVRENKTVSKVTASTADDGQIGLGNLNFWPFVQLYDFSPGGNVEIKYNKGGGTQTTTLTFDTIPSNLITNTLDRTIYPQSAQVHVTMADPQLNIDPTDEDSWTWDTIAASNNVYYGLFDENGAADAVATFEAQDLIGNLTSLMFEKNGKVTVDLAAQGTIVAAFGDNDDQVFPVGFVPNAGAPTQQMTFIELQGKGGVFGNYDESDNANLDITPTAPRGKSATIRYNDVSQTILVGFGFGTLDIGLADAEWNSGEEIPVTLVDSDANKNSRSDEDLDLNDPNVALIPSLRIGNPHTLAIKGAGSSSVLTASVITGLFSSTALDGDVRFLVPQTATFGVKNFMAPVNGTTVQAFSDRAMLNMTNSTGGTTVVFQNLAGDSGLVIDTGAELQELRDRLLNAQTTGGQRGLNLLNYDIRGLTAGTSVTNMDVYLLINDTAGAAAVTADTPLTLANIATSGYPARIGYGTAVDTGDSDTGEVLAVSLGNVTSLQGLVSLNSTSCTGPGLDGSCISDKIFNASRSGKLDIGLLFVFNQTTSFTVTHGNDAEADAPIVADFFSFGITGDGVTTAERTNNAIYRFELEETGDNTSTFIGSAEFTLLNQLNILAAATYTGLRPIDDEATFIVHEDLTDEDAVRINYLDLGADGTSTQIADQQNAPTHSAGVSFDKDSYKVADTVTITLADQDLNVDSDLIDIYVTVAAGADAAADAVGLIGLGTLTDGSALGRLLDVTFDDQRWVSGVANPGTTCVGVEAVSGDNGLASTGFTLIESGTATGIFNGDFIIPAEYCRSTGTSAGTSPSTTGTDIEVNYVDFRDASGETIETGDGAGVRANTGSISLDRTVYPAPFGISTNFPGVGGTTTVPSGRSIFPIHQTGMNVAGTAGAAAGLQISEGLPNGDLTIHIRVNDPDFDVSASGEDKISSNVTSSIRGADGPVKIVVSRAASSVTLATAGATGTTTGIITAGVTPTAQTRELGPITEIAPDAGIFELDFTIRYTDGPTNISCPATPQGGYTSLNQTGAGGVLTRFDVADTGASGDYCILQGDIITVEYFDQTDASGDPNTVTDSATFDLRNGVLQSDKSVYIIGADMIMTLIEPDLDRDSDSAESYDLDLIEWDSDAATLTMGNFGGTASGAGASFDPEPSDFRETGDSTGIFQVVIEIPDVLGSRLDRGEEIQLEYTDWGPSGADFVGDEDEDINLTIYTSNFGATVELDQKVYTWTDKVFITIVAPDHNFDSNLVDEIGDTTVDKVVVATRGNKLSNYKLVETGTDTGIFTGEVILTGFAAHDANGDGTIGDTTGTTGTATGGTATGPTDGFLRADDDDGLTVSFEFTEDETVVGSALIRWNIGEVQFLEASYPATGQGVLRVVDPDMNLKPEAVDSFDVDAWSDSDAGGIDLTVTETNEATGIFEGTIYFTVTDESSGHRLRVAEGDTVTGEYEDNTLPSPYTTADELEVTATTFIGTVVPPLERAPASNPRVVDAFGNELDEVSVDQQVQIAADLANGQDRDQPFAYLVQISKDGVTYSLSWITGSLAPGQSLNPAQSWTPTESGTYDVQIFVWESVDNPDALSPPVETTVTVV